MSNSKYVDKVWEQFKSQVSQAQDLFPESEVEEDKLITEFTLQDGDFKEMMNSYRDHMPAPFKSLKEALKFGVKFN